MGGVAAGVGEGEGLTNLIRALIMRKGPEGGLGLI